MKLEKINSVSGPVEHKANSCGKMSPSLRNQDSLSCARQGYGSSIASVVRSVFDSIKSFFSWLFCCGAKPLAVQESVLGPVEDKKRAIRFADEQGESLEEVHVLSQDLSPDLPVLKWDMIVDQFAQVFEVAQAQAERSGCNQFFMVIRCSYSNAEEGFQSLWREAISSPDALERDIEALKTMKGDYEAHLGREGTSFKFSFFLVPEPTHWFWQADHRDLVEVSARISLADLGVETTGVQMSDHEQVSLQFGDFTQMRPELRNLASADLG